MKKTTTNPWGRLSYVQGDDIEGQSGSDLPWDDPVEQEWINSLKPRSGVHGIQYHNAMCPKPKGGDCICPGPILIQDLRGSHLTLGDVLEGLNDAINLPNNWWHRVYGSEPPKEGETVLHEFNFKRPQW